MLNISYYLHRFQVWDPDSEGETVHENWAATGGHSNVWFCSVMLKANFKFDVIIILFTRVCMNEY